jgi:hypothetical protein
MTLKTISSNGMAVEDYGIVPIAYDQWLSAPAVQYGSAANVGEMGFRVSTRGIQYSPRRIGLGVLTTNTSMAGGRTDLEAWYLAAQGELEIESIDCPGRVCYGFFESATGDIDGVKLVAPGITSIGSIVCYNPFWYDRSPIAFGGAAGARIVIPVGSAPSRIKLGLAGPYTNPTWTLRNRSAIVLATMPVTDTAASATTYLEFDFINQNIDRYVNSVRSSLNNGYPLLDPDSTFFTADPLDGSTLECSSGSWEGLAWRAHLV